MLYHLQPDGTVGQAVAAYTGRGVLDLEMVDDPQVVGTYGLRAWLAPEPGRHIGEIEFLIINKPLHKVQAKDLEEVEFACWPPESL